MAVYTKLTLEEINAFLALYDVGVCIRFSALNDGTTNTNYLIKTEEKQYVLTLFDEVDNVDFLHQIHKVLKDNKFPSVQIITLKDKITLKNKPVLIFSWVNSESLSNPSSKDCQAIGHHLAVLHKINVRFPKSVPKTKDLVWSIERAVALLSSDISDEDADIIEQELNYFRQHSRLELPSGLIHADCFRDNVLFDAETGQLNAIIDFEYATLGSFMFDLAIVINDWCSNIDGSLDRLKMRDVIAAYSHVRPLESIENQSIPLMLRAAAFRFWISRLGDGNKKPPDEFKRILLHRRLSLSGMQSH